MIELLIYIVLGCFAIGALQLLYAMVYTRSSKRTPEEKAHNEAVGLRGLLEEWNATPQNQEWDDGPQSYSNMERDPGP